MATFTIARLYHSLPLLIPSALSSTRFGTEPRSSSKSWISDIQAAVTPVRERAECCVTYTHSVFKETRGRRAIRVCPQIIRSAGRQKVRQKKKKGT